MVVAATHALTCRTHDSTSRYIHNRSNLAVGPESREYIGYFVHNDQIIGNASDTLRVTVPA